MVRTKKVAKFAKNKKYKKLPLDPTPWEELSKDIKGKFKSKIQTQDAHNNNNELSDSKDSIHSNSISILNSPQASSGQSEKVLSGNFDELENKEKKRKVELNLSFESINNKKVKHDHKNSDSDVSTKRLSVKNDFYDSSKRNDQELKPVKQLSKGKEKKVMAQEMSPNSSEKLNDPTKSKVEKLSKRKKLERNKLFEKKRLERRKELGIMILPKNIENRLLRIRKALKRKNLPPDEIKSIMRKERSKAQDEFRKSLSNQICFNCRKPGHLVAHCPLNDENKDISICIKCGSNEHKYAKCKKKITGFPFATCFICKSQGHISRNCPNNEHGIYPEGGKCNLCDSVNHLRRDCPTLKKKKQSITLDTIDNVASIDDELMNVEQSVKNVKSEKPKVVTF